MNRPWLWLGVLSCRWIPEERSSSITVRRETGGPCPQHAPGPQGPQPEGPSLSGSAEPWARKTPSYWSFQERRRNWSLGLLSFFQEGGKCARREGWEAATKERQLEEERGWGRGTLPCPSQGPHKHHLDFHSFFFQIFYISPRVAALNVRRKEVSLN